MTAPKRIQLRRTKGWHKPDGAISVARPTRWGNPWRVGDVIGADIDATYAAAIITPTIAAALYESALVGPAMHRTPDDRQILTGLQITIEDVRAELAGHDLACWCPLDQPCHADVLLELANP